LKYLWKLKVSFVSVHIKSSADYTYYRRVISFGDFAACPENIPILQRICF